MYLSSLFVVCHAFVLVAIVPVVRSVRSYLLVYSLYRFRPA